MTKTATDFRDQLLRLLPTWVVSGALNRTRLSSLHSMISIANALLLSVESRVIDRPGSQLHPVASARFA